MSENLPAPLVPPDVDLRDFAFTPMFRGRLFGSEFHANVSDAGWRAGVTLWLKSWDQHPAGTLPTDDISLCRLAELGRDTKAWRKVAKEALWGWFKCSDGRMHHKTVAEGVMEAWERKTAQRDRTAKARATALSRRQSQTDAERSTEDVTGPVTGSVTDAVTGSKGQGQGQGQGQKDAAAADSPKPRDPLEAECRALVGQEPVLLAQDFHAVAALIAEGLTPDDVRTGIAEALAKADPNYRFRAWRNFEKWIRTAAQNRLAGKPRSAAAAPPKPPKPADPNDPPVQVTDSQAWPESLCRKIAEQFALYPDSWPQGIGPEPGQPGCRFPDHLLPERLRRPAEEVRH